MRRKSEIVLYAASLVLLAGAASVWWQGVRPSPASQGSPIQAFPGAVEGMSLSEPVAPPGDPAAGTSRVRPGPAPAAILVHVAGAVKAPGVYGLKEGQRLYEAVALAGPEEDADLDALNLASPLRDAQKVYVPRKGETEPQYLVSGVEPGSSQAPASGVTFPVNLNLATQRELEELPGIGPVLAGAIVARRDQFGPFERPEDLKNVPGIGEKTYARIAALVTVR